jgi:hypothetical protein
VKEINKLSHHKNLQMSFECIWLRERCLSENAAYCMTIVTKYSGKEKP